MKIPERRPRFHTLGLALLGALAALGGLGLLAYGSGTPTGSANPHGPDVGSCKTCHSADGWKPAVISTDFDHARHGPPLAGAHATASCRSCHETLNFKMAGSQCIDCHRDIHRGEFGPDCSQCHSTRNFIERNDEVRLHRMTRFPLSGAHNATDCRSCHVPAGTGQMMFVNTPTNCDFCHMETFTATTNPDHVGSGFPRDCSQCHSTAAWDTGRFTHDTTGFRLDGAHRSLECSSCHVNNQFQGASAVCVTCHQSDYDQTTTPNHPAAGFPTDCAACHTTTAWLGAGFDHNSTAFPLTGSHLGVDCTTCHVNGQYQGTPTACVSCHQSDYDLTVDPSHAAAGFSTDCASCHTPTSWLGAVFNHNTTAFPLTGSHLGVDCTTCHANGQYQGTPTACVSCHQSDYDQTTNPGHAAAGFPTDCASCHTTTTWLGATFDHDSLYFPIYSGTHRGRWGSCTDCHTNPSSYAQFTCFNCHPHSDQNKTDGDHGGISGYAYDSNACYTCHPQGRH